MLDKEQIVALIKLTADRIQYLSAGEDKTKAENWIKILQALNGMLVEACK